MNTCTSCLSKTWSLVPVSVRSLSQVGGREGGWGGEGGGAGVLARVPGARWTLSGAAETVCVRELVCVVCARVLDSLSLLSRAVLTTPHEP